jgi:XTP/dITP diphosphohydrolase
MNSKSLVKIESLLLATRNRDKIKEIANALQDLNLNIVSAFDVDVPDVDEDQDTLEGNALKKARELARATGLPALADDTGLEVDALNGAPGVYSSRYAGPGASYEDNVNKLLNELEGVPPSRRQARFRTVMAFVYDDTEQLAEGECQGLITETKRGEQGFGYDPVFLVPEQDKTFAEMTLAEKNNISHRGRALARMVVYLRGVAQPG